MKKLAVIVSFWIIPTGLYAQENTFVSFLKGGSVKGHIRNYYMHTDNRSGRDYSADAIGGLLEYETRSYKGFRAGISGIFTYRLFSSSLHLPDPLTGRGNKWERELFDVNHPQNYNDLDRLEELYIKYHKGGMYITYGKIPVEQTPLLNKSDGRMKPFAFQGLWFHHHRKGNTVDAGWIHKVSPRSMTEWYEMKETMGLTDNGFQPDGTPAHYRGAVHSRGIGTLRWGIKREMWRLDVWNLYLDKVNNSSWAQLEFQNPHWMLGGIYSLQVPLAYQKTLQYEKRYVQPDERGQVLSLTGSYRQNRWQIRTAYTRAFDTGRYLFPRELGRDQFYTSMPRSRIEGFGNAHVFSGSLRYRRSHTSVQFDATTTTGIETGKNENNKYNLDDYYQVNTRIHHDFDGFLKGLQIEVLYVWKENKNEHTPETVYQKSNYHQINFVTNFNF